MQEQSAPAIHREEHTMTHSRQPANPFRVKGHDNPQKVQYPQPNIESRTRFAMGENILLSMKDITAHSNLSDKHFYALIKRGLFPRPLKIGRSSRWRKSEYETWLDERDNNR